MRLKLYFTYILILTSFCVQSQDHDSLKYSGFGELYYSYDFQNPKNNEKPFYLYNHKRHNEVNLNLAYVKANYTGTKVRANFGLMAGNYAQYNLANEPELYRFIYEANIGYKLSNKKNLWIDVGIMPSHLGFESAVSLDCWTLSRSLLAENSPYYEAGVKLTSTSKNEKWTTSLLYLNGWQRIVRAPGMNKTCGGAQLTYKPSSSLTFNYSNFVGSDKVDSLNAFRIFNNFYTIYEPSSRWGLIIGFDVGYERDQKKIFQPWYSPVIILRCRTTAQTKVAVRAEYYDDSKQLVIPAYTSDGFKVYGFSANLDYILAKNLVYRIEGKLYISEDKIFNQNTEKNNFNFLTSLCVKL